MRKGGEKGTKRAIPLVPGAAQGFPGDLAIKNPPAMQETQVRSLGREDPLEVGLTTHSSVLAWRSPWTEEPGGLQSIKSQPSPGDGAVLQGG